ncbi:hypothetical protein Z962_07875 [Clostridium botulinum C/D str. BKT12695]|nr:hypothetical protein Z962_07875 [Clostridium botulinum C/D str. BKT12695]
MFLNLDQIKKYYNDLNIKCYWLEDSLTLYDINIITITFDMLHKLYPNVVINEIGDKYSYDKIRQRCSLNNIKKTIDSYNKFETDKDKIQARNSLINAYNKAKSHEITFKINEFGKDYLETEDYYGQYIYEDKLILFNHQYTDDFGAIMIHEFAHALASQFGIDENEEIKEIYDTLGCQEINEQVTEYANKDVEEFIAECFMNSFTHNKRIYKCNIVEKVREIIDQEYNLKSYFI